jgi:hypothetical protein
MSGPTPPPLPSEKACQLLNEFLSQNMAFLSVDLPGDFVLMSNYTGKEVVE